MFNLYYINYAKAFEIAMQIDNKILEKKIVDNEVDKRGEGDVGVQARVPLLDRILPSFSAGIRYTVSKADKTSDTLKVISTKSTILELIMDKAVEIKKIKNSKVGNLIKLKDIQLSIDNIDDMMGAKVLLSGILKQVPVDGLGNVDISDMIEVMLKGVSYIVVGEIPQKVELEGKAPKKLLIKIPLQMGNEMESLYSISDLEIGPVTIVGIYRGIFPYKEIRRQADVLKQFDNVPNKSVDDITYNIEKDDGTRTPTYSKSFGKIGEEDNDKIHFIDVIAIVQDLYC